MLDLPHLVFQDKLGIIKSDQDILIKEVVHNGHLDDNPPTGAAAAVFWINFLKKKHQMAAWPVSSLKLGQLGANFNLIAIVFHSALLLGSFLLDWAENNDSILYKIMVIWFY